MVRHKLLLRGWIDALIGCALGCLCIADALRVKRKRLGGCRKQKFTDGWVEFADKSIARRVAEALNNTEIGMCDSLVGWLVIDIN
jgi:hypothetical protein